MSNAYEQRLLDAAIEWHEAKRDHGDVLIMGARLRLAADAYAAEVLSRRTQPAKPAVDTA
jgi:hypothetical protein